MSVIYRFLQLLSFSILLSSCVPLHVSYYQPDDVGSLTTYRGEGPRDHLALTFEEKAWYRIWLGEKGENEELTLALTLQVADSVKAQMLDSQIKARVPGKTAYKSIMISRLKSFTYFNNERDPGYEVITPGSIIQGESKLIPGWSEGDDIFYQHKTYHVDIVLPASFRKEAVEIVLPPLLVDGKVFEPQPIRFTPKSGVFIYSVNS